MSVTETIRLRKQVAIDSWKVDAYGPHTVVEGSFEEVKNVGCQPDIFLFDLPGVDDDAPVWELVDFMESVMHTINAVSAENAVMIMPMRDRKGGRFLKSSICAATVARFGQWRLYRQYIWMTGEADFHRSRSAYAPVCIWRKGEMPTVKGSELRYKDVIRVRDTGDGGAVWALPVPLLTMLLSLFKQNQEHIVCDLFAGSGSAMAAAAIHGLRSVSVELDATRAAGLRKLAADISTGLLP